ncbi:hypothetical protein COOONC_03277 [Cooperia oncophora]
MISITLVLISVTIIYIVESNRYAEQLYEDLLYYYNKNVRPVKNASESIKVKFGASLIRIIDVKGKRESLTGHGRRTLSETGGS